MVEKDKNNKVYTFIPGESDKEFKRMYQAASPKERKKFGFDLLNEADAEELEINRLANEWLRDGKLVDYTLQFALVWTKYPENFNRIYLAHFVFFKKFLIIPENYAVIYRIKASNYLFKVMKQSVCYRETLCFK
ncbi:hypothetical protein [Bacteroides caecimuris]|uniref:hypothetical protein n=1 Tax=Bacteroides caecimuris TaxID=1796613 RepID=UPI003462F78D